MKVLSIKMTPTHCKGVEYEVSEEVGIKGIKKGIFQNVALNTIINNQHEQQETYHADGSDKTGLVYVTPIDPYTSKIIKPKKK